MDRLDDPIQDARVSQEVLAKSAAQLPLQDGQGLIVRSHAPERGQRIEHGV
jgi:hypothetical protein